MANTRQIQINIPASQIAADVTYMPLLADRPVFGANNLDGQRAELFNSSGSYAARADGGNLRFYEFANQTGELAQENVSFSLDSSSGSNVAEADQGDMQFWLSGDTFTASALTGATFYLEYGDNALTGYADTDAYGRNNVYDANYVSVWHMEQDPSSTAPQIIDSTGNGNHGTSNGGMTSGDLVASKIGNGLDLDGVNDYIQTPANVYSSPEYSVQFWVNGASNQIDKRIYSEGSASNSAPLFNLGTHSLGADDKLSVLIRNNNGDNIVHHKTSTSAVWDSTDHQVSWTDNNGAALLFIDGAVDATPYAYTPSNLTLNTASIGSVLRASTILFIAANVAEFRVSNLIRNAFWISTEYNNQNSPTTFMLPNLPINIGAASSVTLLQMTIGINQMNGGFA